MKVLKLIVKILITLLIVVGLVIGGFNLFLRITSASFYKTAEKEFAIPGLGDNFVPQGITYDENSGYYLVSGYMSNGEASRIYIVDPNTNEFSYISLKTTKGEAELTRGEGIAIYGRYVFLTSDESSINVYRLVDVTNTDLSEVAAFNVVAVENCPANLYVNGDTLYVGEFYVTNGSETPETHHFETDTGETQQAIMLTYDIGEIVRSLAKVNPEVEPSAAYAITDKVQGVCTLKGGQICLSTSSGVQMSHVKIYDDPIKTNLTSDASYKLSNGNEIPVYYLDSDNLLVDYKLPPMAAELYVQGDKVLIMSSAASNKYIIGKFTGAQKCYSFIPEF